MNIVKMSIYALVDNTKAIFGSKQSAHNALRCELGAYKARTLFPLLSIFPSLRENKTAKRIKEELWADIMPWFNECCSRSFKRLQQLTA